MYKHSIQKQVSKVASKFCLKFFINRLQIYIDSSPFLHLLYFVSLVLQREPFICELAMHKDAESVSGSTACSWLLIPLGAPFHLLPLTRYQVTFHLSIAMLPPRGSHADAAAAASRGKLNLLLTTLRERERQLSQKRG